MKKYLLVFPAIFCINLASSGQWLENENLGIISYLTNIKIRCEYKMTSVLADKNITSMPDSIKYYQSKYNSVMISVNRFINQLSADLIAKNSLCEYRRINRYVNKSKPKLPKRISYYSTVLGEIDEETTNFIFPKSTKFISADMLSQIVGVLKLGAESIENARDFREKKVGKIVSLLKDQKLRSISELNDTIKPEKAK